VEYNVVPDDKDQIQKTITNWVDAKAINVIITTGGTGFGVRDTTPEVHSPLLFFFFFSIGPYIQTLPFSRTFFAFYLEKGRVATA